MVDRPTAEEKKSLNHNSAQLQLVGLSSVEEKSFIILYMANTYDIIYVSFWLSSFVIIIVMFYL